jgi:hypothetical protein
MLVHSAPARPHDSHLRDPHCLSLLYTSFVSRSLFQLVRDSYLHRFCRHFMFETEFSVVASVWTLSSAHAYVIPCSSFWHHDKHVETCLARVVFSLGLLRRFLPRFACLRMVSSYRIRMLLPMLAHSCVARALPVAHGATPNCLSSLNLSITYYSCSSTLSTEGRLASMICFSSFIVRVTALGSARQAPSTSTRDCSLL